MTITTVLNFKKLKSAVELQVAAKHNLRAIECESQSGGHINPSRRYLNSHLAGGVTPAEVTKRARDLIAAAGIARLRKNVVYAIEYLVSLPQDHGIDEEAYFTAALQWLADDFGGMENVLSAEIHRDEDHPHLHILLLPLLDGRMVGSSALGGVMKTLTRYHEFAAKVAAPFGLAACPERLTAKEKRAIAQAVFAELNRRQDPLLASAVFAPVRNVIAHSPAGYAAALRLDIDALRPKRKLRSSTSIFISKGKGSQRRDPKEA